MSDHTRTFEQSAEDAAAEHHPDPQGGEVVGEHDEHSHDEHGHDDHGHDAHGHDDHGHDAHGQGGHDAHADHGHHAPPAPKYLVSAPARVGDVTVRTWVAYGIFLLLILLVTCIMLAGFGK